MSKKEVKLPEMGEGIIEATVTQYLVAVGDHVDTDTPILEVATDKVDSEVMAPFEGEITALLFEEGDVVPVGAVVAIIQTEGEQEQEKIASVCSQELDNESVIEERKGDATKQHGKKFLQEQEQKTAYQQFVSPTVRALLQQNNLPLSVLDDINPTGADHRVTKQDVENYIKQQLAPKTPEQKITSPQYEKETNSRNTRSSKTVKAIEVSKVSIGEQDEIIEMGRMRKLIAQHMVDSVTSSPHVTSFIEADLTQIVNWRNKVKKVFQEKYGEKLTFTTLFVEAVVKAIQKYPMINISVDGENIIKRGNINIGMATALPDGNLIVPVIQNARVLNLVGLAKRVNTLADKARNNKLAPTDIKGGTFTITNLGAFDSLTGTPIINQPEVAILAVGAIQKKPAAVQSSDGNYGIAIRDMMMLAMSYDHRVVDGGLGGNFLKEVRNQLQDFNVTRTI